MEVYRLDIERARDFIRAAFPAMALANMDSIARPLALAIQAARHEQMELDAAGLCDLCAAAPEKYTPAEPVPDVDDRWQHARRRDSEILECDASFIRAEFRMRQAAEDIAK